MTWAIILCDQAFWVQSCSIQSQSYFYDSSQHVTYPVNDGGEEKQYSNNKTYIWLKEWNILQCKLAIDSEHILMEKEMR